MLAANPLDNDSRRKIADLLLALGDRAARRARSTARSRCTTCARATSCPAIVGCKVLESLGERADEIVAVMATTYAHERRAGEVRGPPGARRPGRGDDMELTEKL